ncbi:MAG: PEGA domain-containing protein [Candidatus Colwellbacteria bacterium]|nr:PEGA domain-containing protein [Candidatus Colwellbacteria bacterium]MBI4059433.1 PEGA domain-containing protein [Candidatus Microgenomates bacterium]
MAKKIKLSLPLRLLFLIGSFAMVALVGWLIIQYAQGLRFDIEKRSFEKTGILVATSNPDAAQILVNGALKNATNTSLTILPGTYDVEIAKEGFTSWKKRVNIESGIVTKAEAWLFPKAPSLSPLTFFGAANPLLSPNGTKLAWLVSDLAADKGGIWVIDLGNLPFGFNREARQVSDTKVDNNTLNWSPDSRNLILTNPSLPALPAQAGQAGGTFLLDPNSFTPQTQLVNISGKKLTDLKASWAKIEAKNQASQLAKLPEAVQDILLRKSTSWQFSPDENKVIYTASGSAKLAENLTPQLPGSSSQKQSRDIKANQTYIYDIKEDRNFLVSDDSKDLLIGHLTLAIGHFNRRLAWFPTSKHLLLAEPNQLTIMDYDGTNRISVWAGQYQSPFAFPTPDGSQIIILTNLGATNGEAPNLYTLKLR